jgi:putative transposase
MFVTLRGEPWLLWRAADSMAPNSQTRRDKAAAKRFFNRVLAACPETPKKIVTDQLQSYPAAKAEIAELANVKHVFAKACARVNNRAENSHQPTRERERWMRRFQRPERAQIFLSCFGSIRQHFALKRHLLRASLYRKQLAARSNAWRLFTGVEMQQILWVDPNKPPVLRNLGPPTSGSLRLFIALKRTISRVRIESRRRQRQK